MPLKPTKSMLEIDVQGVAVFAKLFGFVSPLGPIVVGLNRPVAIFASGLGVPQQRVPAGQGGIIH